MQPQSQSQSQPQPDVSDRWIQHQRRNNKTTPCWACTFCEDRKIYTSENELKEHARIDHHERLPLGDENVERFLESFAAESAQKRPSKDSSARKPNLNEATKQPEPPPQPAQSKRPLNPHATVQPTTSITGLGAFHISTPRGSEDVAMQDLSEDSQEGDIRQPRKRVAVGDGISAGSGSPLRDSSAEPSPCHSKPNPVSGHYGSTLDPDTLPRDIPDTQGRAHVGKRQLWSPDQEAPLTKASFNDPSNIASVQLQKSRAQQLQPKPRKSLQHPQTQSPRPQVLQNNPTLPSTIQSGQQSTALENYDIILQPETRPISQEQLVAEVKGIYAGLVMVEAKCIEVDNKQATLAQADPGAQPKLNNEQWQALIALHRTLLHEHHDFFLASQHPSASPALRRLASKYAMPARMWRHGIHSFLELLRHRLPASLDHMLAFIYLAYSMMALLYETVPAFEDTWIECLGDLGRYRMAIEDDDIRDREVWTGVARHWYSKASDKAPTTGRLYHHLAILARPNALQQLFYYSKSLCVVIPFTSARESILTLFEPVLNAENHQGQYRLPPLDTSFVKAHGLLFTNRSMEKFFPTVNEFLGLLDNQIGRVTRKFMEQGYYIAVANCVAVLGFASKENPVMQAMIATDEPDVQMSGTATDASALSIKSFENAQYLSNATLEIVLQRIGDPNVLPFIHVTLVFMYCMARHPRAMSLLEGKFPWKALTVMLNTLLAPYQQSLARIESSEFPLPVKDDVRPFTEDFAMRGLLFADGYYPEKWFLNDKIDDEEKYLEVASMTDDRKERILWLACRLAELGPWIRYNGSTRQFSTNVDLHGSVSRSSTFASATTVDVQDTWPSAEGDVANASDEEDEFSRNSLGDPRALPGKPRGND